MYEKNWWQSEFEDAHKGVYDQLEKMGSSIQARIEAHAQLLSIYLNRQVSSVLPGRFDPIQFHDPFLIGLDELKRIKINVIEALISTLASRYAAQHPKPRFITSNNDENAFEIHRKAKQLEKFVMGEFQRMDYYKLKGSMFIDAAIFGLGALKFFPCNKKINCELVRPWEIIVDDTTAFTTNPYQIFQRKYVIGDALKEDFPDFEEEIESAYNKNVDTGGVYATDIVEVVEGWYISKNTKKHVICVDNQTLLYEDWPLNDFPFVFFKWSEPRIGWYPQSLVEQQKYTQLEFHKVQERIQDAVHLASSLKVFAEKGTIEIDKITEEQGIVIEYEGPTPPIYQMPSAISSDIYQYVEWLKQQMYETSGVSQLSASSIKPPGIRSAAGIRELLNTEAGRHGMLGRAWEKATIDASKTVISIAKLIHNYSTRFSDRKFAETIKWSDVDMDEDCYDIQVFPASMMPSTPAGKMDMVERLIAGGFTSREEALQLIDLPDTESFMSLNTAALEDFDRQISNMLNEGIPETPEPFQGDLTAGIKRVTSAMIRAKSSGAPEDRLQLMRNWVNRALDIVQTQQQAMMPPTAPGPQSEGVSKSIIGG